MRRHNLINFKIDQQTFELPNEFDSNFVVQSIPKAYSVQWLEDNKPDNLISNLLQEHSKSLLLIDEKVYDLYCNNLHIDPKRVFKAPATEEFKTLESVTKLVAFLEENNFTKSDKLIVVGGGIIQDIGGFTGACFKRGINWIFLPTTLLSMCDSCIGGKTGVNHNKAKNQLALFSAPEKIIINPYFLDTLDNRELKSGFGEILKLLSIGGSKLMQLYAAKISDAVNRDIDSCKSLILAALYVKKVIVENDEFELNIRKSLNYGHTIGHVIETLSNYQIPHGQAVSMGMLIVNEMAYKRNLLSKETTQQFEKLCYDLIDLKVVQKSSNTLDTQQLLSLLQKDKKTLGTVLQLVIITEFGITDFIKLELTPTLVNEIHNIIRSKFIDLAR
jgi:3-dehydroquinate synthase